MAANAHIERGCNILLLTTLKADCADLLKTVVSECPTTYARLLWSAPI
jgi:hypothetical protein